MRLSYRAEPVDEDGIESDQLGARPDPHKWPPMLFPLAGKSVPSEESPSLRLSRQRQGGKTGGPPGF
jgi:hypothetical protein